MKKKIKILAIFAFSIFCTLYAYKFSPSVASISAVGNNSSFTYTVNNEEQRPIPIEITIHKCVKDIYGNVITKDEDQENFIVYPSQFILKKGETRKVQVRWIGDPEILIEQTYSILCKELEIPLDEKEDSSSGVTTSVNVLLNYTGRLYVKPEKGNPDIVIDSYDIVPDGSGSSNLVVDCYNQGRIHGKLVGYNFIVSSGTDKNQVYKFSNADIPAMSTSIFALSHRKFIIPWEEEYFNGSFKIELVK